MRGERLGILFTKEDDDDGDDEGEKKILCKLERKKSDV